MKISQAQARIEDLEKTLFEAEQADEGLQVYVEELQDDVEELQNEARQLEVERDEVREALKLVKKFCEEGAASESEGVVRQVLRET